MLKPCFSCVSEHADSRKKNVCKRKIQGTVLIISNQFRKNDSRETFNGKIKKFVPIKIKTMASMIIKILGD
jgi:hypothetical protein